VNLDGLERNNDLIFEARAFSKRAFGQSKMAKVLGYKGRANTTIYKETDMQETSGLSIPVQILG